MPSIRLRVDSRNKEGWTELHEWPTRRAPNENLLQSHFDSFFSSHHQLRHGMPKGLRIATALAVMLAGLRLRAESWLWLRLQRVIRLLVKCKKRLMQFAQERSAERATLLATWLAYWRECEGRQQAEIRRDMLAKRPLRTSGAMSPAMVRHVTLAHAMAVTPEPLKAQTLWELYWLLRAQWAAQGMAHAAELRRLVAKRTALATPLPGGPFLAVEGESLALTDARLFIHALQVPRFLGVVRRDITFRELVRLANGPPARSETDAWAPPTASPAFVAFLNSPLCVDSDWLLQRNALWPIVPRLTWKPPADPARLSHYGLEPLPSGDCSPRVRPGTGPGPRPQPRPRIAIDVEAAEDSAASASEDEAEDRGRRSSAEPSPPRSPDFSPKAPAQSKRLSQPSPHPGGPGRSPSAGPARPATLRSAAHGGPLRRESSLQLESPSPGPSFSPRTVQSGRKSSVVPPRSKPVPLLPLDNPPCGLLPGPAVPLTMLHAVRPVSGRLSLPGTSSLQLSPGASPRKSPNKGPLDPQFPVSLPLDVPARGPDSGTPSPSKPDSLAGSPPQRSHLARGTLPGLPSFPATVPPPAPHRLPSLHMHVTSFDEETEDELCNAHSLPNIHGWAPTRHAPASPAPSPPVPIDAPSLPTGSAAS
eukprot:EG_transcript_4108